jgi:tetratricopeptide (TPR) repeat protein
VTAVLTTVSRYRREDVLRILHLHSRQLHQWERSGLITQKDNYSFQDLVELRKLRDLSSKQMNLARIRDTVEAMRRVTGMESPLLEADAVRKGSRLVFRHDGAIEDPFSPQLMFDFDCFAQDLQAIALHEGSGLSQQSQLQEIFLRAVQLEEAGTMQPALLVEATSLYKQILESNPQHAPACINLGTIHYNQGKFAEAEALYRRATVADGEYALAFFDLGNVLDELHRLPEAVLAYQRAIELVPNYADAHYNLALAYERQGERRRALRHWMTYMRLDPVGPWASHARGQAKKILGLERLSIIHRGNRPVRSVAG